MAPTFLLLSTKFELDKFANSLISFSRMIFIKNILVEWDMKVGFNLAGQNTYISPLARYHNETEWRDDSEYWFGRL